MPRSSFECAERDLHLWLDMVSGSAIRFTYHGSPSRDNGVFSKR
ncbi:hypothetical protein [Rhodohalobacter sp. SW132]|nr:hypothetical protein [Rhodohalobacter sp. SW132]